MRIVSLETQEAGSLIYLTGKVQITQDELGIIVRRSGHAKGFEDRMSDAVCSHLAECAAVPKTHDLMACVLSLESGSSLLVWGFDCVGVGRFS